MRCAVARNDAITKIGCQRIVSTLTPRLGTASEEASSRVVASPIPGSKVIAERDELQFVQIPIS